MTVKHIDRRIGSGNRGTNPTGLDRRTERLSEYFLPERGELKVKRYELLAILTMVVRGEKNMKWYRRLWRWLTAQRGSGPVTANPQPATGETVLGEHVGDAAIEEGGDVEELRK